MQPNFTTSFDLHTPTAINGTWEEYENVRLERVKEQRQRMETMNQVVSEYNKIIMTLQIKNEFLEKENSELKRIMAHQTLDHNNSIKASQGYLQVEKELQEERKIRFNCQNAIEGLQKELLSLNLYKQNYSTKTEIESDFEILQNLYEELKDELYLTYQENLSLKEVIRDQSRFSYDGFWKTVGKGEKLSEIKISNNTAVLSEEGKTPSKKKTSSENENSKSTNELKETLKFSLSDNENPSLSIISKSNPVKRSNQSESIENCENLKQKNLRLKDEIKKLNLLVEKFKYNEEQQLNLIEILKGQESKISHAKSSKKTLQSQKEVNSVSFKL